MVYTHYTVYLCTHVFITHRSTEERAQTAEEKALETQYVLKLAEEKIATLERRLEMMGIDIEAEKKVEEQRGAKEEDKVSNDETNLEKENRGQEDKSDNDQKKKSKSSGKSRKK